MKKINEKHSIDFEFESFENERNEKHLDFEFESFENERNEKNSNDFENVKNENTDFDFDDTQKYPIIKDIEKKKKRE